MNRLTKTTNNDIDYVASHLRSHIVSLHHVLETIERTDCYQEEHIIASIRAVEKDLRRIRKMIDRQKYDTTFS